MFKIFIIFLAANAVSTSYLRDRRIIGGNPAPLQQVPSMVSIRRWGSNLHVAGGALISTTWVLTSAHYLVSLQHNSLDLVVGIVDLSATGQSRRSDLIERNPNFDGRTRQNDIACVRMQSAVIINQNVFPIVMVSTIISDGHQAHVSGWGATESEKGENSQFLNRLLVTTEECPPYLDANRLTNEHSNMCAKGADRTGLCTTDIGGPLIDWNGLIGLASWHRIPCATELPDVFVRISYFRNWIRLITNV